MGNAGSVTTRIFHLLKSVSLLYAAANRDTRREMLAETRAVAAQVLVQMHRRGDFTTARSDVQRVAREAERTLERACRAGQDRPSQAAGLVAQGWWRGWRERLAGAAAAA